MHKFLSLVTSILAFLLLTLAPGNGQPVANSYAIPANCSRVCGVSENLGPKDLGLLRRFHNVTSSIGNTADCNTEQYPQWTNSTREFMSYIGLNETKFGCTRWKYTDRPPDSDHLLTPVVDMLSFNTLENFVFRDIVKVENPGGIDGSCRLKMGRGLLHRVSGGNITTHWLFSSVISRGEPPVALGSTFFIAETETRRVFLLHVPRNDSDVCVGNSCPSSSVFWLPASVFNTSVTYNYVTDRMGEVYRTERLMSLFVNWKVEEVPGMKRLLAELSEGVALMQNIDSDLSPSNLAILCLPLIMSIPPISLLGSVSNRATMWYAFATDFLAALPLLIKGIELIVSYYKATPTMLSSLSIMGEHYGIVERWFVECHPPPGRAGWVGVVLVSVSSWFILASNYAEFLFWRMAQYQRGQLKGLAAETDESIVEQLPDGTTEMLGDVDTAPGHCSRLRRTGFRILGFIFVGATISLAAFQGMIMPGLGYVLIDSVFSILVVLLRAIISRRLFQFARWRFQFGILFGLICGPLYLVLHAFENVRKSERWAEISDGAHIGFASLAMILSLVIDLKVLDSAKRYLTGTVVFMMVLGISIALLHLVRNEGREVTVWRYGVHGFALGVLFGPFGFLFRRCFPELRVREGKIRRNLFSGIAYGMLFVCALSANVIGNVNRTSPFVSFGPVT